MTSSSLGMLLVAVTVAGCGGAQTTPAQSEGTAPAPAAQTESAASSASTPPSSEGAGPSGTASANPSAPSSAEPTAQAPKRRGAPVEIAIGGKHAGDAALERIISGAQTGLDNCYEAGLANAPTAAGVLDFQVHVTASGAIKKVESAHPNTMPGTIATCMVGKFGALSFEPKPATTIEVKVTCHPNE